LENFVADKLNYIQTMLDLGCAVVPLVEGGKKPAVETGVKAAKKDKDYVVRHFTANQEQNYAVATGQVSGVIVIDVDGADGLATLKQLIETHARLQKTIRVKTPHGVHIYFKAPNYRVPNSVSRLGDGIDVRGDGGYVVGPGSATPDGEYKFVKGCGPDEVRIAPAPNWLLEKIGRAVPRPELNGAPQNIPPNDRPRALAYAEAARTRELDRLKKAPKHQRNNTLNLCALKLGQFLSWGLLDAAAIEKDLAAVASSIGLGLAEIGATIRSGLEAGRKQPRRLPFLQAPGPKPAQGVKLPVESDDQVIERLAALGETDTDNAERFAVRVGHKVLYSPKRGWLVFDGKRYRPDDGELQCIELAKDVAQRISGESKFLSTDVSKAARARFAQASKSKASLDRMVDLAKGLLVVEDSKLDADPYLLNAQNGTVDLRTRRIDNHDPRDLLTKVTSVAVDLKAECPLFMKFFNRITGCDAGLMEYIQKAFGYTVSGLTSEQVFFFVHGKTSQNGKSTLVNLIRDLVGHYGCHSPTETFMTKQYENAIPADLARLAGSRMVTAIEANFNRQLDEAKLKGITGGEPIAARFLYGNFFEFAPEFKLWMVANDRPKVRSTDNAIWRRTRVVPMNIPIPEKERDKDLSAKLLTEGPAILGWAVRGFRKWQRDGLVEPTAVKTATADWRRSVDHLGRFIGEAAIFDPDGITSASALHNHYKTWCSKNGESPLSPSDFKAKVLESCDVTHRRTKVGSMWFGVKLRL
jgi:putative DNA primase/helicase